ncbi:hypothetical protein A4S06_11465 [Erysipelotrichaceae bacterium MTC7]|nr:hypothetical protein A4S06_11465 [Erysipelotrichaceae bacterium MTC7]
MNNFRKLGVPALVILVCALIAFWANPTSFFVSNFYLYLKIVALIVFGATLNVFSKKNLSRSPYKKIVAVLLVVFMTLIQLNIISLQTSNVIFQLFNPSYFWNDMIYIYCGYLFVD